MNPKSARYDQEIKSIVSYGLYDLYRYTPNSHQMILTYKPQSFRKIGGFRVLPSETEERRKEHLKNMNEIEELDDDNKINTPGPRIYFDP